MRFSISDIYSLADAAGAKLGNEHAETHTKPQTLFPKPTHQNTSMVTSPTYTRFLTQGSKIGRGLLECLLRPVDIRGNIPNNVPQKPQVPIQGVMLNLTP